MKLVLDTNIYISAFYWGGNSQKVINRIIEGIDELFITDQIINEISDVMARPKFKTEKEIIVGYINTIKNSSKKINIEGKITDICRDKNDDDKIECAVTSEADFLLTGDNDLLVIKNYNNIRILTQKEYLDIINNSYSTLQQ